MEAILTFVIMIGLLMIPLSIIGVDFKGMNTRNYPVFIFRAVFRSLLFMLLELPVLMLRGMGAWWGDQATTIRCVNGCKRKIKAIAVVTCRGCGYRSRRGMFSPCPLCGATRRHVSCPHCHMSIPRTAYWTQKQPPRKYH